MLFELLISGISALFPVRPGQDSRISGNILKSLMHRLPSTHIINKFRIASFLVVMKFLTIPVALWFFLSGVFVAHDRFLWAGLAFLAYFACKVMHFLISSRLRCPLCMMPPLSSRGCARHRSASRVFGSYKLAVAGSILFKDSFRCPYCGEPTMMAVRKRGRD